MTTATRSPRLALTMFACGTLQVTDADGDALGVSENARTGETSYVVTADEGAPLVGPRGRWFFADSDDKDTVARRAEWCRLARAHGVRSYWS